MESNVQQDPKGYYSDSSTLSIGVRRNNWDNDRIENREFAKELFELDNEIEEESNERDDFLRYIRRTYGELIDEDVDDTSFYNARKSIVTEDSNGKMLTKE